MSSSATVLRNFVPRSFRLDCAHCGRSDERSRSSEAAVPGRGGEWLGRVETRLTAYERSVGYADTGSWHKSTEFGAANYRRTTSPVLHNQLSL